ncbi:MAG: ribosome silencing factor [Cytophagales bacterium]|nr:ribosome silencing factor [Cytophagales bacterium]
MQKTAEKAHLDDTSKQAISSTKLSEQVVLGMLEKKAEDVVIMDLREVKTAVADYFVICSGNSDTQIDAISASIEEQVRKIANQKPWKREGREHREWILIDYVDVVVHVFNKEKRKFYGLEELWGDARIQRLSDAN